MKDQIISVLSENGIECGGEQAGKLSLYLDLLIEENRKTNLTAITDKSRAVVLHLADSLLASRFIPGGKLLDIGSGAGLPAVPLAVMRGDLFVTALDSTEKKTAFIARAARELGLLNLSVLAGRAEELGRDPLHREKYDSVTARAVARFDVLCELALPLVRKGGVFVALKGKDAADELRLASNAAAVLGGRVSDFSLPLRGDEPGITRHIVVTEKISPCPAGYPRRYSKIKSAPL